MTDADDPMLKPVPATEDEWRERLDPEAPPDLVEGLRLRGGMVLPIATWAGWTPADRPGGVRAVRVAVAVIPTKVGIQIDGRSGFRRSPE